jgi:hypothetical protein
VHSNDLCSLHQFRPVLPGEHGPFCADERLCHRDQYELRAANGRRGGEGDQWIHDEFSIDLWHFGWLFPSPGVSASRRVSHNLKHFLFFSKWILVYMEF